MDILLNINMIITIGIHNGYKSYKVDRCYK